MFDRLLKPKWQHPDPRKRQAAVESGNVPLEALATLAREDSEPAVRCCAIRRVDDLGLLAELLRSDPPSQIREAVEQRQQTLLGAPLDQAPSLETRLKSLQNSASPSLCDYLARHAVAVEIRSAALQQIRLVAIVRLQVVGVGDVPGVECQQLLFRIPQHLADIRVD